MDNVDTQSKTLAEQLAAYCVELQLDQVPEAVVDYGRYLLLDLLGAALAGVETPEVKAAGDAVSMISPEQGPCLLWGTSRRTSPSGAALSNGIAAHARELDDFGGVDHTGAVVVPALLALGDAFPSLSGKTFLEALIVGYDVGRRVLDSAGGYRPHNHVDGYHSTGSCGSFAAAASAAKALGLDEQQTTWALGLAGSFTGGTWAFSKDSAMSKRYHVGRAAETGVVTACLARNGFTGPAYIFEAEWGGFLSTYAKAEPRPEELIRNLGNEYGLMRSGIKPYAACRDIHSTIDVILEARNKNNLAPADIEKIEVACIPEMMQMVGGVAAPKTRLEAQLSLPYSIGVALVTGRAFLGEYEPPLLHDPEIQRVAKLVRLVETPELPFDSEPYISITTTSGECIKGHVDYASGAPQNPLGPQAIIDKFEALAARVLSEQRVQALKKTILSIEQVDDVRSITDLLQQE